MFIYLPKNLEIPQNSDLIHVATFALSHTHLRYLAANCYISTIFVVINANHLTPTSGGLIVAC